MVETDAKRHAPPEGLGQPGMRLWGSVVDVYELEEHEIVLLLEACRTVDVLAELDEVVRREGPLVETPLGDRKANPALTEGRQQKIVLARILAALRLPAGEDNDHQAGARQQRRVGARGVYGIRGLA